MEDIVRKLEQISIGIKYNVKETLKEILMRRVVAPLIYNANRLNGMPRLTDELSMLFKSSNNFLVIMLLSARFDVFQIAMKYIRIPGKLEGVVAPHKYSFEWLSKILQRSDVKVFYPYLRVGVHDTLKLFANLSNATLIKGDDTLSVTSSHYITRYVFSLELPKRCVIIYAQPHFPWLSDIELSTQLYRYVAIHELIPGDIINIVLKQLRIPRKRILRAYFRDMIYTLKYVSELVEYSKKYYDFDRIVITGVHGELLGEFGFFLHKDFPVPQLVVVPWYEILK
jgi:hypothetical protein